MGAAGCASGAATESLVADCADAAGGAELEGFEQPVTTRQATTRTVQQAVESRGGGGMGTNHSFVSAVSNAATACGTIGI